MKRIWLTLLILLAFASSGLCADTELQDLTDFAAPGTDDLVYCVDDPGGVAASRKCTINNLLGAGTDLDAGGVITANGVALGTDTTGNYAAGDAEAGAATSGDSATSFFSSGTIEDARLPTSMADKAITGSLNIPNGVNPTIDAAGEIALDTTGTQILIGTSASTLMTISGTHTFTAVIENLAAADDDKPLYSPQEAITLRNAWAICVGTCTTEADIGLEVVDIGAGTVTAVTGTIFAEDQSTARNITNFTSADRAMGAGDLLRFNTGAANPSPETDTYAITVTYTEDRQ